MSWLQTHEVAVPYYEVRAGKQVFAIEVRERALRQEELARNWSSITSTSSQQFFMMEDDENNSITGNTSGVRVTARRSYSQFRKLWRDLIRVTKTPSTASLARSNSAHSNDPQQAATHLLTHSFHSLSVSKAESDSSSSCRCRGWNCAFRSFHYFLKSYPFPSKLLMKRNTPAVLENRRQGLELFVTTVRGLFDTFPRPFLQSIDDREICHVLSALNDFFGFKEARATMRLPSDHHLKSGSRCSSTGSSAFSESSTDFSSSTRSVTCGTDTWSVDKDSSTGIEWYLRQDDESSSDATNDFDLRELENMPGLSAKLNSKQDGLAAMNRLNVKCSDSVHRADSAKKPAKLQSTGRRSRYYHGISVRRHTAFLARNPSMSTRSCSAALDVKAPQTLLPGLSKLQLPTTEVTSIRTFLEEFRDHLLLDSQALGSSGTSLEGWNEDRQWELALYVASQIGHVYAVESILYRGTNPNAVMEDGLTSLHAACRGGHRSIVAMLLTHGADTNITDTNGAPPLLSAVQLGDLEIVEMLVEFGANVNLCNADSVSAVHVAVACQALPVLQLLLEMDAFVNTANSFNGKTPLHLAAQCGSIPMCEQLLQCGANIRQKTARGLDVAALAKSHGHQNIARFCLKFSERQRVVPRAVSESVKMPQTAAGASTSESSEVTIVSEDGYAYAVL